MYQFSLVYIWLNVACKPGTHRSLHNSMYWEFLLIFGYIRKEITFLKGLVNLGEIRNIEDLM